MVRTDSPLALAMRDLAVQKLETVGFVLARAAETSESLYLRLPGREGLLRVSCHSGSGVAIGGKTVARLTFSPQDLPATDDKLDTLISGAIGRYMMKSTRSLGGDHDLG